MKLKTITVFFLGDVEKNDQDLISRVLKKVSLSQALGKLYVSTKIISLTTLPI